ncbi:MAG: S9 family peptidase [Bacteroidota bacterium]
MKLRVIRVVLFSFLWSIILFAGGKELTLDDIFGSSKFSTKSIKGLQWLKDGKSYTYLDTDTASKSSGVYQCIIKNNSKKLIVTGAMMKLNEQDPSFRFSSYQWSPDEKQILFVSAPPEKQYLSRLTPAGNLFLYDVTSKKFNRVTNVSVPQYNQKFSPDGKKIGYVRENNIYLYDIQSAKEFQLTMDGTEHIINGKFDWVYEEEFGISDGWRWSPDGSKIAYWQLDENRVPEYTMTEWDSTHLNLVKMRYPKPGDPNSIVKIGVVDVASGKTDWIDLGVNDDIYIPRIQWTNNNDILSLQRLNREQNTIELLFYIVSKKTSKTILTEKSSTWLDVQDDLRFLKNGNFTWSSDRDGFNHLYLYKNDGSVINQITKGEWDVDAFYGVDERNGLLYYTSSESTPLDRHIYSIKLDGDKKKQISSLPGTNSANFSPTFEQYIGYYNNVSMPMKIKMMKNDGKELFSIEENEMPMLKEYSLANITYFTITTSDSVLLYASLLKPSNFDSTKKYPVLFFTYGGPGSQVVRNSWGGSNYLWYSMLADKGYLVFMVDNRGTGARGAAFKKITYKNLGKWEVNDQIEGAKYLAGLPFVDKERIGIWGWSYGGYMASLTILNGADYFKTAIAVAPVTHWKFYDNIYTERFMGTPQNNPEGYKESAPIEQAKKLKGKFLLVHGTSDDNVHFQNAVTLVSALQQANKQFETMYYPNKNHGIGGGMTRIHLYTLLTRFLMENL